MVAYALDQMVGMLFAYVFDAEVIDNKAEADWAPLVAPKARSVLHGGVTIVAQEADELLFGEYARLWKAIHAAAYFNIDFGRLSGGTLLMGMKKMVLVGSMHLSGSPCARRPNSLAAEQSHMSLVVGSVMRSRYSMDVPVSACVTGVA